MKILSYFSLSVFFLLLSASYSAAFRCGMDPITTGYTKKQVRETCGKPSFTETVCADDEFFIRTHKTKKSKKCIKKVERWRYNCGYGDFIYILTFEKGILTKETTSDRGYGSSECLGNK